MNINHLVLGAAGVLAATSAQAADLPVAPAPEPIDYVRICDAYGSGFFFIPGTETCLKIDGYVRFNVTISDSTNATNIGTGAVIGGTSYGLQSTTPLDAYVRGRVNFDARENTAWGTLRGYIRLEVERDIDSDADGVAEGAADDISTGDTFIQIGDGFLAGYTQTNFAFWTGYVTGATAVAADNTVIQVAYTAGFGNGIFATLALEDSRDHANRIVTRATGVAAGIDSGHRYPDIVGNIAYEQGIVAAQVMGAVHWVEGANDLAGIVVNDEIGFAVGAGVEVDLPFLAGVSIALQGGYAYGAPDYICSICGNVYYPDATVDGLGNLDLSQSYSIAGGINAAVTDQISVQAQGGWHYNEYGNFDSSLTTVSGGAVWAPLDNFTIGTGLEFVHATSEAWDGPDWSVAGTIRLQRNF